jgi:membrane protease YdiL (CAAX protease family)
VTEAATAPSAASPVTSRWGLGDVLLGFATAQLGGLLATSAVLSASGRSIDEIDELPLSLVALSQVGLWVGLLGVPWAVTRLKGRGLVADLQLRIERRDLWQGGLLGALLQIPVLPLLYWPILTLLDRDPGELSEPAEALTDRADSPLGVLLLVLIVGLGAPIIEEIFYRGLFMGALRKRGMGPVATIGISSVVFGLSHGQLLQLPALVLAGVLFGVLAHRAGRLGPAIAAHVAFNMVTVVSLLAA